LQECSYHTLNILIHIRYTPPSSPRSASLSLHDALPISLSGFGGPAPKRPEGDPPAEIRHLAARKTSSSRHRVPLSPSIKTRTTSGRENSGGGMIPSLNMARTLVPDSITWCSSPWGQVL